MTTEIFTKENSLFRSTGQAAIACGISGFIAVAFLIAFLTGHFKTIVDDNLYFARSHDAGAIFQFLLMIPVIIGLHKFSQRENPNINRTMLRLGVLVCFLTSLFALLGFPKFVADVLYMFPQGIFGIWLMIICWQRKGINLGWLRWFGIVVGLGLALVGTFPPGYAIFVHPDILYIPQPPDEFVQANSQPTFANAVLHMTLMFGSLIGVFILPFWTILLGVRLLREKI